MAREINIYNTLTRKKERFEPIKQNEVSMYACGVTTYDHYHIGHALQAIYFDIIRNYLEYAGYKVTYVRNYTDVDDKIIARAKERGISPLKLSQDIIASSEEDMAAIGCRKPDHAPKVSESIPEIIVMIEVLIKNNAAYVTKSGDVYYRVRAKEDYGKLSNRKVEELLSGTRNIVEGEKEDELDFALWKADTTAEASWPSPWSQGRPGWHIECSAMAKRYLGDHFDIHGGGLDLVFPHHENEIAQSESANRCKFANVWIHNGLLTIEKQKMSKSLGNQITLKDFLKNWPGESLRLAYVQYHYRSNIDFQKDTFIQAHKRLYYYYSTLHALDLAGKEQKPGNIIEKYSVHAIREKFHEAMSDDFNSSMALGEINKAFKSAGEVLRLKSSADKSATAIGLAKVFRECLGVFGLLSHPPQETLNNLRTMILPELGIAESEIQKAIADRKTARSDKNFTRSDEIRDQLAEKGIELMDTPAGTDWKIKYEGT